MRYRPVSVLKITAYHRIVYQFALEFHIPGEILALKRLLSSKKHLPGISTEAGVSFNVLEICRSGRSGIRDYVTDILYSGQIHDEAFKSHSES